MALEDQESTTFITHRRVFAYKVVPFGLLNAGATFQRTMDTIFAPEVGGNMQIYVDDMIFKSLHTSEHTKDLRETFARIRDYSMRLNPTKCSFGLARGKFFGFLLTHRGIEADPAQISAIKEMTTSMTIKELQTLMGCIAALRRFIRQSSKRALPLYEAIKVAAKSNKFSWNQYCEESFINIKDFLQNPPF